MTPNKYTTPNPDGTVDIVTKLCERCGMEIPDVPIYKEEHDYKAHGIGAADEGDRQMSSAEDAFDGWEQS